MDCDRSALLKKAIKATARLFENEHGLAVAFFLLGRLVYNLIFQSIIIVEILRDFICITIYLYCK